MYFNNEYNLVKQWDILVYPGVTINGKSYERYTKEDLIKSLNEEFGNQMSTKTITIKSNGQSNTISFSKLNPTFNTEEVANDAINFMKNRDFFTKVSQIIGKKRETLELTLKYNFNLNELNKFIDKTADAIKKQPVDASIKIEDNSIKITDEINGQTLKKDELFNVLKSKIEEFNNNNIELDAIVDTTTPKITREILSKINGKLSESSIYKYQYDYDAGILYNIQLISNNLNGALIYPNEKFSFNELIGDPSNGDYRLLTKAVNGVQREDYFGISESAAVLFDAILRAGIIPNERCKGSEPVDYVTYGMEAIINYNKNDLKFTNKYQSPIYIESAVQNGILTISIYSDISELKGKTYTPLVKDITESDANSTQNTIYIDDSTLEYGKTEVIQTALPKKIVEVYLQSKDQDNEVVEKLLYKQTYNGRSQKIRKGTKVTTITNTTDQSNLTNNIDSTNSIDSTNDSINNSEINTTNVLNTNGSKVQVIPRVITRNAR